MSEADRTLRLGTRGSPLARWQAEWIAERLRSEAGCDVELLVVKTTAEKFPEQHLASMGSGIFTKELDDALLKGNIDLAVHSLKDVPSQHHEDLHIAAVPERESPWDAFISRDGVKIEQIPKGATIGTSSPRRQAQLLAHRADLKVVPLRGNVQTRLRRVSELGLAGTILAHAGLKRLGREELISELFDSTVLVPAVAQGALAVMTRIDDTPVLNAVRPLDHAPSRIRISAERAYLRRLRGGCQVPAGALAEFDDQSGVLKLVGALAAPDGSRCLRGTHTGDAKSAEEIGTKLAGELLDQGGEEIITAMRS
ncbi:MAG: hydroxymethylbilane synthase [Planctomycetes bacterium]|nr:hydroxymethylbilane synthase [Planctomycetota bacterium]